MSRPLEASSPQGKKSLFTTLLRFACAGSVGTAIQYIVLGVGVKVFAVPAVTASVIGYGIGSVANYFLNHRFTFRSKASHTEAAAKYYTILGVGLGLNYFWMWLLVDCWNGHLWTSQILTTTFGLLWNFTGSTLWAFREPPPRLYSVQSTK